MASNEYTFHAMGTVCVVTVAADPSDHIDAAIARLHAVVAGFEAEFSRFRPDSAVSALNRWETVRASKTMLDLLAESRTLWDFSRGFFDPLIDVRTRGYVRSFETGVFERGVEGPKRSFDEVSIRDGRVSLPPGAYLDFGSVAKGYLADRLADALGRSGFPDCVVNLGGDVSVRGTNAWGSTPRVAVSDAGGGILGTMELSGASVSTSGSYVRHWNIGGERLHHLKSPLDDRTDELRMVGATVVHARGSWSDALATALFAMGTLRALAFCETKSIDALLLLEDNSIRTSRNFAEKYRFVVVSDRCAAP